MSGIDKATPQEWDRLRHGDDWGDYAGPDTDAAFKPRKVKGFGSGYDHVSKPEHYNDGKIECVDYIEDRLTEEQFTGYLWGNVIKYIHRWPHKGGRVDLEKAEWYLNRLIEEA